MQGIASSLLALGCSLVSLAPVAFLSPTTPNMALSRGAVADKRALQLQVFRRNIFSVFLLLPEVSRQGGVTVLALP